MSILIIYAGKSGTTEKAVKILQNTLPNSNAVDLKKETPAIADFDTIIFGGSIRIGKLSKEATAFLEKNKEKLLQKKLGLFLCCAFSDKAQEFMKVNYGEELINHATAIANFGGELDVTRLKGSDKLIAKMVTKMQKKDDSIPEVCLYPEAIKEFGEQFS